MRIPSRVLALVPLFAIATLAAAPPPFGIERGPSAIATKSPAVRASALPSASASPQTSAPPQKSTPAVPRSVVKANRRGAPADPPDGTYTYELSRNGTAQGTTTVALFHRSERSAIETNEVGHFGAATESAIASFAYADFATQSFVATYRAPFARDMPLGRSDPVRQHVAFGAPTTVRYDLAPGGVRATVDGVSSSYIPIESALPQAKYAPFVMDAPFMTSALLIPGFHGRTNAPEVAWYALAFPQTVDGATPVMSAAISRIATPSRFPKTPKNALAIAIPGLGTIWFDPGNAIVYEAHFDALNVDARLATYARMPEPAPVETPQPISTPPHIASRAAIVSSEGTRLGAVLDLPSPAAPLVPAVVLIPPGPAGDRNFDSTGPQPMFVDLALGLTARGIAVLRYDPRGTGAQGRIPTTWDDARADARAAIAFAQSAPGIDPARVFALGYGNGADLALAAAADAASASRVAGVVALAPTTMKYQECARKQNVEVTHPTAWQRTAFAHDPTKLAAEANVSLFVLQPGVSICGESPDQVAAYDDALKAASPSATIVVADDLSQRFGGRYDADSQADTQEFFPYRFDASTLGAIADWIAGPHDVLPLPVRPVTPSPSAGAPRRELPPPPGAPSTSSASPAAMPSVSPLGPH
jgi:dienelactone hydrolase